MVLEAIRPRAISPFRMLDEMERIMEETFRPVRVWRRAPTVGAAWSPTLCMWEKEDSFVVQFELPGVKKEDVEISLSGDTLNVKGEYKAPAGVKEEEYACCEVCYGPFSRAVDLPVAVNVDKVEAIHENGLLEIRVPKAKEAVPTKIQIKAK